MRIATVIVGAFLAAVAQAGNGSSSYNPWDVHVNFVAKKGVELIAASNDLRAQAGRLLSQRMLGDRYHLDAEIVCAEPKDEIRRKVLQNDFAMSGAYGEVLVELLASNSCVGDFTETNDGRTYRFTVSERDNARICVFFLSMPQSWVEGIRENGTEKFLFLKGLESAEARTGHVSRDGRFLFWRGSVSNCDKLRALADASKKSKEP